MICLALLDREPETYPRAAAKWASRFAIERRLTLTDAQLVLSALAVLPGEGAGAGVEALIELADRYRLQRIDELLTNWAEKQSVLSVRTLPSCFQSSGLLWICW